MERRSFLALSSLAVAAPLTDAAYAARKLVHRTRPSGVGKPIFGLTSRAKPNPDSVAHTYNLASNGFKARAALGSTQPYAYMFYDEQQKKFVSPIDVKPTLDASKTYILTPKLHAFNIKKSDQSQLQNLQSQIQLGFNATAPNPVGDLTWIFMNAIDIFAGKNASNPSQLTQFMQSNGASGASLSSAPKVTVTKGKLTLQVTAFGQKKEGFWQEFIDAVTQLVSNPVAATALAGFGIPALASDALQFVDHSLDVLAQDEKLVTLWATGGLDFGIDPQTTERFKLCPGLWFTVDFDYAQSTNLLQDHTVELALGSFQLLDKNKNAADANYLVADLEFDLQQ